MFSFNDEIINLINKFRLHILQGEFEKAVNLRKELTEIGVQNHLLEIEDIFLKFLMVFSGYAQIDFIQECEKITKLNINNENVKFSRMIRLQTKMIASNVSQKYSLTKSEYSEVESFLNSMEMTDLTKFYYYCGHFMVIAFQFAHNKITISDVIERYQRLTEQIENEPNDPVLDIFNFMTNLNLCEFLLYNGQMREAELLVVKGVNLEKKIGSINTPTRLLFKLIILRVKLEKGEFDEVEKEFLKLLRSQISSLSFYKIQIYIPLLLIYFSNNQKEQLNDIINQIMKESESNMYIPELKKFCSALVSMQKNRRKEKVRAEILFEELIDSKDIYFELKRLSHLFVIFLNLEELSENPDAEVLDNLQLHLKSITNVHSGKVLTKHHANIIIIRARMELLTKHLEEALNMLNTTLEQVENNNLSHLYDLISEEIEFVNRTTERWIKLGEVDSNFQSKIKDMQLHQYLQRALKYAIEMDQK